ncbi:GGDEF domain-containing protein [uncultured Sphaerochaeta sp.]|uniref:GGDEF domain-containing protein n=1 Tax=uncultured Sphaerochaeta sp. TaxID=886478 RepID=UPI002A0A6149|nr:GGDEF domain-containing protein [uncultured Sphaerochaeta sp.]
MTMPPNLILDLFSIIPLLFTINMANRHRLQNPRNKYYVYTSLTTIVLLLTEIFSFIFVEKNQYSFVILHRLMNTIGFSLSPAVPYFILYFVLTKELSPLIKKLLRLPIIINCILSVLSFQTGWLYYVNANNEYMRGPFFLFTTILCLLYFGLDVFWILQSRYTFDKLDQIYLFLIILLPLGTSLIQIAKPEILTLWGGISMTLLLFYIFTLELTFEFDNQTQVRNREGFEREMQNMATKNATIFVFDLNNLKKTNDFHGHKAGDTLLFDTAKIIESIFLDYGFTFRIGGDEFCVICKPLPDNEAKRLLSNLMEIIIERNTECLIPIDLAYGFTNYQFKQDLSIFTAFAKADNAMYEQKAKYKKMLENNKNQ